MSISLQMIQKPPVIFTQYAPSWVISPTELARYIHCSTSRSEAITWLWFSYSRSILAEVDPCMEANEGADATIRSASSYLSLSQIKVSRMNDGSYELSNGGTNLYLYETDLGEVFLYFFTPKGYGNQCEDCQIDLTDFGADAAAAFIATVFDSYERIADYYETNTRGKREPPYLFGV